MHAGAWTAWKGALKGHPKGAKNGKGSGEGNEKGKGNVDDGIKGGKDIMNGEKRGKDSGKGPRDPAPRGSILKEFERLDDEH